MSSREQIFPNETQEQENKTKKTPKKRIIGKGWLSKIKNRKTNKTTKEKFNLDNNLDSLGTIKLAKLHKNANRPLKKMKKEFDENVKFCPCCSLPVEQKGILERFKFFEHTDIFIECGSGIPLFFSFFKFSVFALFFISLSISLPTVILTNKYTTELMDLCIEIYKEQGSYITTNFPECENFIGIEGISKYFINGSGWALKYSGMNMMDYRVLHYHTISDGEEIGELTMVKKKDNHHINSTIVDYSLIYFLSLISLLFTNLLFIILNIII